MAFFYVIFFVLIHIYIKLMVTTISIIILTLCVIMCTVVIVKVINDGATKDRKMQEFFNKKITRPFKKYTNMKVTPSVESEKIASTDPDTVLNSPPVAFENKFRKTQKISILEPGVIDKSKLQLNKQNLPYKAVKGSQIVVTIPAEQRGMDGIRSPSPKMKRDVIKKGNILSPAAHLRKEGKKKELGGVLANTDRELEGLARYLTTHPDVDLTIQIIKPPEVMMTKKPGVYKFFGDEIDLAGRSGKLWAAVMGHNLKPILEKNKEKNKRLKKYKASMAVSNKLAKPVQW